MTAPAPPKLTFDRDACPACSSRRVRHIASGEPLSVSTAEAWRGTKPCALTLCLDCAAFWEAWPADTPIDNVERAQKIGPCDTCAYRSSSPERRDLMLCEELAEHVEMAAEDFVSGRHPRRWFGCHKGVPIKVKPGWISFDYEAVGRDPQEVSCAGFLVALWRRMKR